MIKELLAVVLAVLMLCMGMPPAMAAQGPSQSQEQCSELYQIGAAPANPNRMAGENECTVDFSKPIPGLMKYRKGWGGNKCLPTNESLIFKKSAVSAEGKLLSGTDTDVRRCGNGFRLGITLDLREANRVEGEHCSLEELGIVPIPDGKQLAEKGAENPSPPVSSTPESKKPTPVEATHPPSVFIEAKINHQEINDQKVSRNSVVIVEWWSRYADECHAVNGIGFDTSGQIRGQQRTPSLRHNELYKVECTGRGGSSTAEVLIRVNHKGLWIGLGVGAAILSLALAGHGRSGTSTTSRVGPPIQ